MRSILVAGLLAAVMLAGCAAQTDTDQDGLSDAAEAKLGTNPKVADTDGDGLSDATEVQQQHTNATVPDTDGDGVTDGVEVAKGKDPLNATDEGYVVPPVPAIDAKALLADHAAFVTKNNERAANKPTHESARVDLLAHFKSYGLTGVRFNFTNGIPQADIMGIKWGVDREHWVFVGGHYDTITDDCLVGGPCALRTLSQGAYDDGSGTMMTVHLAKAFANVSTYYTVAFVAYDGEERGIQGARAIVDAVQEGNFTVDGIHPIIVGDLDLDMIGINWPGTMAPINMLDNTKAGAALVKAKAKAMGFPDDQLIEKDGLKLGSSDYSAFWGISDPAPVPTIFFISDFEELGAPNAAGATPSAGQTPIGAYPFWHLEDTVETMTGMAGGPDNLLAGFQSASDLAAYVVHFMSCQPDLKLDATAR